VDDEGSGSKLVSTSELQAAATRANATVTAAILIMGRILVVCPPQ
jgi:hypothetical protein